MSGRRGPQADTKQRDAFKGGGTKGMAEAGPPCLSDKPDLKQIVPSPVPKHTFIQTGNARLKVNKPGAQNNSSARRGKHAPPVQQQQRGLLMMSTSAGTMDAGLTWAYTLLTLAVH